MTKFEDKSFSVPMPGEAAKQWPKCLARSPKDRNRYECKLDLGHSGKHVGQLRDGYLPDCDGPRHVEWK